jgi:hypothetical protein
MEHQRYALTPVITMPHTRVTHERTPITGTDIIGIITIIGTIEIEACGRDTLCGTVEL